MSRSCSSRALTASRMRWHGADRVFRLADVGAFARQPEHDVAAAERVGDVDGSLRALDGVAGARTALLDVNAPSIVLGCSHSRGATNSQNRPSPSSIFLTRAAAFWSGGRVLVDLRHDVVVVELHAVEAELLVFAHLGGEGHFLADLGTERDRGRC